MVQVIIGGGGFIGGGTVAAGGSAAGGAAAAAAPEAPRRRKRRKRVTMIWVSRFSISSCMKFFSGTISRSCIFIFDSGSFKIQLSFLSLLASCDRVSISGLLNATVVSLNFLCSCFGIKDYVV